MRRPSWGRLVSGAAVLAAAAGVVAAGSAGSAVTLRAVPGQPVRLAAGDAALACPAPPELLDVAEQPETDEQFAADAETVTGLRAVAAGDGEPPALRLVVGDEERAAEVTGSLAVAEAPGTQATTAGAVPEAGGAARLAAAHLALTGSGDLRGLAVTGCAEPVEDAWVVAGSTVVGRSARLELVNPGPTTATVDLTVLTPSGAEQPQAGQDVALAPGETQRLLLEGLVPGAEALAVRVEASGGRVAATLVETRIDGLTPQGVESSVAAGVAAQHHVVPGVLARDAWSPPNLRIAVPGAEDAVVRWTVLGTDGPVAGEAAATTVPAGTVVDIPVEGLTPGTYAVAVDADVPVVAAVRTTTGPADAAHDIAWSPAGQPLSGTAVVALPPRPLGAVLALASDETGGQVEVQALDAAGEAVGRQTVDVADRASVELQLGDLVTDDVVAVAISVPRGAEIAGAVVFVASAQDEGRLLSVVPVRPEAQPPGAVTVRTSRDGTWP